MSDTCLHKDILAIEEPIVNWGAVPQGWHKHVAEAINRGDYSGIPANGHKVTARCTHCGVILYSDTRENGKDKRRIIFDETWRDYNTKEGRLQMLIRLLRETGRAVPDWWGSGSGSSPVSACGEDVSPVPEPSASVKQESNSNLGN